MAQGCKWRGISNKDYGGDTLKMEMYIARMYNLTIKKLASYIKKKTKLKTVKK